MYRESAGRLKVAAWLLEMLDLMEPGATSMTLILNGLHSICRTSVNE